MAIHDKQTAALNLAARGWSVFPLWGTTNGQCDCKRPDCSGGEAGKHPYRPKSWKAEATQEADVIAEWWGRYPNANVAVATGSESGILVVDCDECVTESGFQQLQNLDPRHRAIDEWQTVTARTGRGGYHLFFRCPDSPLTIGSKVGGNAIDFRCNGGYVVAPPSANGSGAYEWVRAPDDCDIAEPEPWLTRLLLDGKRKRRDVDDDPLTFSMEYDLATHPGVSKGERNAVLCQLVGKYLAGPEPRAAVLELAHAFNARCSPPQPVEAVDRTVASLIEKDSSQSDARATDGPARQQSSSGLVLITRRASTIQPRPIRWLWPNHVQIGAVNLVAGPEGRGKSMVAVDIAARTTTGAVWPDGSQPEQGRVLYCSAEEDAESVIVPRLIAAGADLDRVDIVDGLGKKDGEVVADIDLRKCLPAVREKLEEADYRLCVWDTFQSCALSTNHKENTEQKAVVQPLQTMAEDTGVAVLCIEHHARGGFGRGNPDSAVLGGGLTRTARVIFHVIECPDDPEETRLFIPGKMNNTGKDQDLGWKFTFSEVRVPIADEQRPVPRVRWLEPAGVSLSEVASRLSGGGQTTDSGEFDRAVEWLRNNLKEPTAAGVMEEGYKAAGISKSTITRARTSLMIETKRVGTGWLWYPAPEVTVGANPQPDHFTF